MHGGKHAAANRRRVLSRDSALAAALFILPAAVMLLVFVVYPIGSTFLRSLYDATGSRFVGLGNYLQIFQRSRTLIALRNNVIWVIVVPIIVSSIGLVLAVLSDRLRWRSAFRLTIFLPLVVSGVAAGVTFRFVYTNNPDVGLLNAVIREAVHVVRPPGPYPGAVPSTPDLFVQHEESSALRTADPIEAGETVAIGIVRLRPDLIPDEAQPASPPEPSAGEIAGVVWFDFARGGEGTRGAVDPGQRGLPGMRVQLVREGRVVETTESDPRGRFSFAGVEAGPHHVLLPERNFREPYAGLYWLGPTLIIASLICAYIWMQTGFALVIIGAGLSGINRDYLDSARVEGANEWQVMTRVTVPLLRQALMVVIVTTTISVLKIFDLVIVVAPESVQAEATVLALEMWRASFGGARDFGLGSALAILLFLLIVPAMAFNVRRFRLED